MFSSRIAMSMISLALMTTAHAEVAAPRDVPYTPGTIRIDVDATNVDQHIFRIREMIPVQAGALTLLYPRWLPGNHGPSGPIDKIAGLQIQTGTSDANS